MTPSTIPAHPLMKNQPCMSLPAHEDPPRTRQSLLILAAFRPWGGSQDGRRTGGRPPTLREPPSRVQRSTGRPRILSDGGFA